MIVTKWKGVYMEKYLKIISVSAMVLEIILIIHGILTLDENGMGTIIVGCLFMIATAPSILEKKGENKEDISVQSKNEL